MESVQIWYLTDNNEGRNISNRIKDIGLDIRVLSIKDIKKERIVGTNINFFIFDFVNYAFLKIISFISDDQRLHNYQKFIFLKKRELKEALNTSMSFLHTEFLSRPVNKREFILLLEKSVIVERYREVMRYISEEAETRIGTYEKLMDINRRDLFVTDKEKEDFKNILNYEKNLLKKQAELNYAIREYTLLRQKEMFYDKNRIKAEEMLEELRRQELIDADKVIRAQENVIDFSSSKLFEASQIIDAKDKVEELGRQEAVQLHKVLAGLRNKYEMQLAENDKLKQELIALKTGK